MASVLSDKQQDLSRQQAGQPQPPSLGDNGKKTGLFTKSKDFLQTAVDSLTGKELPRLVDEFTREMVVVAEGLSEDQATLRNAQVIQGEEQDKLAGRMREMEKQLKDLQAKVDILGQKAAKRQRGESGLSRILRQATILAAILAGAWVVVTLVNAFVR